MVLQFKCAAGVYNGFAVFDHENVEHNDLTLLIVHVDKDHEMLVCNKRDLVTVQKEVIRFYKDRGFHSLRVTIVPPHARRNVGWEAAK